MASGASSGAKIPLKCQSGTREENCDRRQAEDRRRKDLAPEAPSDPGGGPRRVCQARATEGEGGHATSGRTRWPGTVVIPGIGRKR